MGTSTALKTDHYELTMLEAALESGVAHHKSVFEVFARKLPTGRRYGVVGGTGRLVQAIEDFRFGPEEMSYLRGRGFLKETTLAYLETYRFSGRVTGYQEGELYFPFSPVLTVETTFAEGVLLETLALSILNADSAVASAASRMVCAAEGTPLIEMGSRRTNDESAVASARVAIMLGFSATSNLEAGRRYGVPTRGTSAHAFTLAHMAGSPDADTAERTAFAAQVKALGVGTTLLVDTFDTGRGIVNAVEVAGTELGAVRIDSGDLAWEARRARDLLDSLGATSTKVVVSGDLDEYSISELKAAEAPVDSFGVGTQLVVGSGHPTASFVYKLVSIADSVADDAPMRSVAKKATSKASVGGHKHAWRRVIDGHAVAEVVVPDGSAAPAPKELRELTTELMTNGRATTATTIEAVRATHQRALGELSTLERLSIAGTPVLEGNSK